MKGRTNNVPQITKAKGKTIMGSISPGKSSLIMLTGSIIAEKPA